MTEEKRPLQRDDLKQKIRERDEKISELEWTIWKLEEKIKDLQAIDEAFRRCAMPAAAFIEQPVDCILSLRMKVAILLEQLESMRSSMKTSSLLADIDKLKKLAYIETGKNGGRLLYKDLFERKKEENAKLRAQAEDTGPDIGKLTEIAQLLKEVEGEVASRGRIMGNLRSQLNQKEKLIEELEEKLKLEKPIKLGIKDKHGVEMREGDILKMPDGKNQVLSWGTEEKAFYGIGNTVTVVSAGFRVAFDGEFKASDCEIVGQSKIKFHREEI
jgi:chromosome segregation ATPase